MVLDLDTSRVPPEDAADRPRAIRAVADSAAALIAECGGRSLIVTSPSGGRHVYVFWATPRPFIEVRLLTKALARRFPVVDTSPMEHTDGQIRGPGSPHKSIGGRMTGYMSLTCSVQDAEAICARPCGANVWEALHVELAAELATHTGGPIYEARHAQAPEAPLDTHARPYWPRHGGRTPLPRIYAEIACTGKYAGLYTSSSEARQAILTSAAARGWRLHQVQELLQPTMPWAAIADWWRDTALLDAEWEKAVMFTAPGSDASPAKSQPLRLMSSSVHRCNTSENYLTPPGQGRGREKEPTTDYLYVVKNNGLWGLEVTTQSPWEPQEYQQIRSWQNALLIVERLLELEWGRRALSYRAILRAIGAAAQMSGSTTLEFGTRQLAYAAGVDHTTVCRALRVLRTGPYALIDKVADAQGVRADVYHLVIPDAVAVEAAWRRWRSGRIEAIHPVFRVLGHPAAIVYETLSTLTLPPHELAAAALLPRSTTHKALLILASHGLAERVNTGGWRRGSADLDVIAIVTGAAHDAEAQLAGHREDRKNWHAYLGIVTDASERAMAQHQGIPKVAHQRKQRRRAPSWLIPPPRIQLITETDILRPANVDSTQLVGGLPDWPKLPVPRGLADLAPDVVADICDDQTVIAAEQRTPTQEAEYQHLLRQLHHPAVRQKPDSPHDAPRATPHRRPQRSGPTRGRPPPSA
ncbi:hypothetical protein AB0C84_45125 [Actinomadura sp. NPDC048955]|uniref:hypothetical protein n=1 Tax=Actinomadura sp. NPDC048955 TaxID=3158228 RepID=UPI0033FBEE1C